jgi:hypothetical protein
VADDKLYQIIHSDGRRFTSRLNADAKLDAIRKVLQQRNYMRADDAFLVQGAPVAEEDEPATPLSEILETNKVEVKIGHVTPDLGTTTGTTPEAVQDLTAMTEAQKMAIFDRSRVFRGLVIGADGIKHSDRDCYGWRKRREDRPDVVQGFATDYTFNKTALEIVKHSIDKADAHLTTPKGSGKAEYEYEKKLTTNKSTVTEYLLSKCVVRKASISAEREDLVPNERFEKAVSDAVQGKQKSIDGYANLLGVLNVWGYYVPLRFTLGGMVYATDQTEIKDFSEAETEKQTFKASFDLKIGDIGGGGGGEHSTTTTTTNTRYNKYQATQLQQIGGLPGLIGSAKLEPDDAKSWAVSLNAARNWEVVEYARLLPTLCLIKDASIRAICLNLIRTYRTYPAVLEYQKVVQMADYALAVQGMDDNPYS